MILFHGTSADAAKKILREGFCASNGRQVWTCSGDANYFWSPEELTEGGYEDGGEYAARQRAFESAQGALAMAKDCRTVVFAVEVNNSEAVEPDQSCENMEGAVCVFDDVPASAIRKVWVSNDLSLLKGYFLAMMHGRDLANVSLSKVEERIVKDLKANCVFYPDDIEELAEEKEYSVDNSEALCKLFS